MPEEDPNQERELQVENNELKSIEWNGGKSVRNVENTSLSTAYKHMKEKLPEEERKSEEEAKENLRPHVLDLFDYGLHKEDMSKELQESIHGISGTPEDYVKNIKEQQKPQAYSTRKRNVYIGTLEELVAEKHLEKEEANPLGFNVKETIENITDENGELREEVIENSLSELQGKKKSTTEKMKLSEKEEAVKERLIEEGLKEERIEEIFKEAEKETRQQIEAKTEEGMKKEQSQKMLEQLLNSSSANKKKLKETLGETVEKLKRMIEINESGKYFKK